jgi:hypothetical protein
MLAAPFLGLLSIGALANQELVIGWAIMATSGLMFIASVVWLIWVVWPREDIHRDILADFFPHNETFQLGACDVYLNPLLRESSLRVIVVIQNRYDGEIQVNLFFPVHPRGDALAPQMPACSFNIPPAAVIVAWCDVFLPPAPQVRVVCLKPDGNAKRIGPGQLVRFANRSVMQTEVRPWMTVGMAMRGSYLSGGERTWTLQVPPIQPTEVTPPEPAWKSSEVWTPRTGTNRDQLTERLMVAMND